MNVGLNIATLGCVTDFTIITTNAKIARAKGIEFPVQMWQDAGKDASALDGLPVWCLSGLAHKTSVMPESLLADSERWEASRRSMYAKCLAAVSFGSPKLALQIDALSNKCFAESKPLFFDRACECIRIATLFGLRVVFEYLSHKVARASGDAAPFIFCEGLAHAREMVTELNLPPRSLLLDIIHWYGDGMSLDPGSLVPDIGYVHLADYSTSNTEPIVDSNRVLPFAGNLPLKEFVRSLCSSGYIAPMAIEIFPGPVAPSLANIADAIKAVEETSYIAKGH